MKKQHPNSLNAFLLVGSQAWDFAKMPKEERTQAEIALETVLPEGESSPPIVIDEDILKDVGLYRIAPETARYITIQRANKGEAINAKTMAALCLNIAKNTQAQSVHYIDEAGQLLEDLSGYVDRIRKGEIVAESVVDVPKLKENDRTNEKARAFQKWLGLDMALRRGSREIYAYDGKTWKQQEHDDLEERAVQFFDECELGYSDSTIDRLINTLKAQLPRMGEMPCDLIAFDNGVLNRNTLEFKPHNRLNWLTACIPHSYDENAAETPNFDRWLAFVSDGNQDKAKNILAALYAILTNRYNWQVFFQVTGKGGSGKSVFAGIATLLAGDKNTASGRLENFDDERKLAGFEDKKLIICSEQAKYAGDGGGLKAITGGDMVRIDPKHKQPFNTKITALIMIVNNQPCKWTERNGGIDRRIVNYCFDKVTPEKERDPYFMDKITLEIGGIIRKVLDTFPNPAEAKKALEAQKESKEALEIKKQSDPLTDFFEYLYTSEAIDGLYIGSGNTIGQDKLRTHLYPAYLAFAKAKNMLELGLNTFVVGLEQAAKQHGNKHDFTKRKTNKGQRTNVHFKRFEDFQSDILN